MVKKSLRPTGRKPYQKRVFAKSRRTAVYATARQYSVVPRTYFSGFPNQFRITLRCDTTQGLNIANSATGGAYSFPLCVPRLANGTSVNNVAGGLLPLMYIYQRCLVMKAKVTARFYNTYASSIAPDLSTTSYQISTCILTEKQANDFIVTNAVTYDEVLNVQGARDLVINPFPGVQSAWDTKSVDVQKFIGGNLQDHVQSITATEGGSNFNLVIPSSSSTQNLPTYFVMLKRQSGSTSTYIRMTLIVEFDCLFTNVRPLEQMANELKPWAIA